MMKLVKWVMRFLSGLIVGGIVSCTAGKGIAMINTESIFEDKKVAELADAVRSGDAKKIKRLVQDEGVDPNARSIHGAVVDKKITLLQWAIYCQSKKGFSTLLEVGADPLLDKGSSTDDPLLHFTATINDPDYLAMLLKYGVDPNFKDEWSGETALFQAINKPQYVQLLLDAGADIHVQSTGGRNLLFVARDVKWLLEKGVDPSVRDSIGRSFQSFYFSAPEDVLLEEEKKKREWVREWLRKHNIEIEG